MSECLPGSRDWWIETALIVAGGLGLAWVLWDGPLLPGSASGRADGAYAPPELRSLSPCAVSALIEQRCITAEPLRALREGRVVCVTCADAEPGVILRDIPPPEAR